MQAAFAFPKKCRQSISLVAVTPVVLRQCQCPWPGSVFLFSSLSLGIFVVLGGSAHVQGADGWARSLLCHGIIRHCAPWSKCHPCGTRALSVPGCCKILPPQVQLTFSNLPAFPRGRGASLLPLRCSSPLEQSRVCAWSGCFGEVCAGIPHLSVPREV